MVCTGVFGWWPALAMACWGQICSVWVACSVSGARPNLASRTLRAWLGLNLRSGRSSGATPEPTPRARSVTASAPTGDFLLFPHAPVVPCPSDRDAAPPSSFSFSCSCGAVPVCQGPGT